MLEEKELSNDQTIHNPITDNDEIFIFIGIYDHTYFFMHTINNSAYDSSIAHQIYNCLIHHKIIIDPTYDLIIYDILENDINIINIVHNLKPTKDRYINPNKDRYINPNKDRHTDPNIFYKLAKDKYNLNKADQLTIRYSYDNKYYSLYEFDNFEINSLFNIPYVRLNIQNVQNIICMKPFD